MFQLAAALLHSCLDCTGLTHVDIRLSSRYNMPMFRLKVEAVSFISFKLSKSKDILSVGFHLLTEASIAVCRDSYDPSFVPAPLQTHPTTKKNISFVNYTPVYTNIEACKFCVLHVIFALSYILHTFHPDTHTIDPPLGCE